jgi:hypothetical protein
VNTVLKLTRLPIRGRSLLPTLKIPRSRLLCIDVGKCL